MQVNIPPQAPLPPSIIIGPNPVPEWVPPFVATMLIVCIGAWLLRPLIGAWVRRIEGRGAETAVMEEMERMRERLAELEMSAMHTQEIEERLDFAERVLAQRSEPTHLPLHRTPV